MPDPVPFSLTSLLSMLSGENIAKVSMAGLLIVVLVMGQMGIWVWGTQLAEAKKDRDEWKVLALKAANLVDPNVRPVGMAPPPAAVEDLQNRVDAKLGASNVGH